MPPGNICCFPQSVRRGSGSVLRNKRLDLGPVIGNRHTPDRSRGSNGLVLVDTGAGSGFVGVCAKADNAEIAKTEIEIIPTLFTLNSLTKLLRKPTGRCATFIVSCLLQSLYPLEGSSLA